MIERDRDTNGDGTLDQRLYVAQDANFNVTSLIDTAGAVVERFVTDPYGGSITVLTPTWGARPSTLYVWTHYHQGLRFEASIALYNNRERYFSPSLGRFTSQDPIGFAGGYFNLYVYIGNGPVNAVDPSGLQGVDTLEDRLKRRHYDTYSEEATKKAEQDPSYIKYFAEIKVKYCPNLGELGKDFNLAGPTDKKYNCLSHTWWIMFGTVPADFVKASEAVLGGGLLAVDKFADKLKMTRTQTTKIDETKFGKVKLRMAVYGIEGNTELKHILIQLPDGRWISKLGPGALIIHKNLKQLEGPEYGKVVAIYELP